MTCIFQTAMFSRHPGMKRCILWLSHRMHYLLTWYIIYIYISSYTLLYYLKIYHVILYVDTAWNIHKPIIHQPKEPRLVWGTVRTLHGFPLLLSNAALCLVRPWENPPCVDMFLGFPRHSPWVFMIFWVIIPIQNCWKGYERKSNKKPHIFISFPKGMTHWETNKKLQ